jgi:hypothetical protein
MDLEQVEAKANEEDFRGPDTPMAMDIHSPDPLSPPESPQARETSRPPSAIVEDIDDEVDNPNVQWVNDFPNPAGSTSGPCATEFEQHQRAQRAEKQEPWSPFESQDEWELARWLMTVGVSQAKMDSFLKLIQ